VFVRSPSTSRPSSTIAAQAGAVISLTVLATQIVIAAIVLTPQSPN